MDPIEALGTLCATLAILGSIFARSSLHRVPLVQHYFTIKLVILLLYLGMDLGAWLGALTMTDLFFDLRRLLLMAGLAYNVWRFNWDLRQSPPGSVPPPSVVSLK